MLAEVGNLRDDQREIPFVLLVWMDVKTHEEIINESAPKTRSEKGNGDIRLFPNHVLGLFIGPQSEEDRLPKLVVVRPLREHLGAKCQSAPFDDWPKSDDCHRNRQCAERGKSASYVRKTLDHARTSGRWIALLIPFF
jgi:hypothetical protein